MIISNITTSTINRIEEMMLLCRVVVKGGGVDLPSLLAFLLSVISSFLPKLRGDGPPGHLP